MEKKSEDIFQEFKEFAIRQFAYSVFMIWIGKLNDGLIDPDDADGMADLFLECLKEL